jgi:hypothetical protein
MEYDMNQTRVFYDEKTENGVLLTKFYTMAHLVAAQEELIRKFNSVFPDSKPFVYTKVCKFKTDNELKNLRTQNKGVLLESKAKINIQEVKHLKQEKIKSTMKKVNDNIYIDTKQPDKKYETVHGRRSAIREILSENEITQDQRIRLEAVIKYNEPMIIGSIDESGVTFDSLYEFTKKMKIDSFYDFRHKNTYEVLMEQEAWDNGQNLKGQYDQLYNMNLFLREEISKRDGLILKKDLEIKGWVDYINGRKAKPNTTENDTQTWLNEKELGEEAFSETSSIDSQLSLSQSSSVYRNIMRDKIELDKWKQETKVSEVKLEISKLEFREKMRLLKIINEKLSKNGQMMTKNELTKIMENTIQECLEHDSSDDCENDEDAWFDDC